MATGKRYYWMKLKESFMTSDTIDYFMSQPNGSQYVVLYNTDIYYSYPVFQYLLGHSSVKMTMDIYTHLEREETSKTQDILNQFYKKSSQKSVN